MLTIQLKLATNVGQHKKKNNLDDIVKMLVLCDRSTLPRFVALGLSKLPPISIDYIDVSSLMRKQQLQEVEIANLKTLVQEILTVTAETSKRVELGLFANPRASSSTDPTFKTCAANVSGTLSFDSPGEPADVPAELVQGCSSGPSYSEVV